MKKHKIMFDEHIPAYTYLLDVIRKKNSDQLIRNDSFEHAKVLAGNLFTHAKKEILIYTSSFCEEFYLTPEIFNTFQSIKNKDISVKVLIHFEVTDEEEKIIGQKKALEEYKSILNDKFEFKYLQNSDHVRKEDNIINNFIVVDGIAFRYEKKEPTRIGCISNERVYTKAIGSINDQETANYLIQAFNQFF